MNKKELWQRFIKTGRVSDYLAYTRAEKQTFAPRPTEDLSAEFAAEFLDMPPLQKRKDETIHDDPDERDRDP